MIYNQVCNDRSSDLNVSITFGHSCLHHHSACVWCWNGYITTLGGGSLLAANNDETDCKACQA